MNNQLPASPAVERKHDAVFATAETDNHSTYLLISGVKIRAYLAGGVVNISVDLTDGTVSADDETVRYAIRHSHRRTCTPEWEPACRSTAEPPDRTTADPFLIRTETELAIDPIPLLLELSDRHLPPGLADTLPGITGLTVSWTPVGVLLHVPARHQLSHTMRRCPASMAAILRYARGLGCDYVLIGPDADIDQALPAWER